MFFLFGLLTGCSSVLKDNILPQTTSINTIVLNETAVSLKIGDSTALRATISPQSTTQEVTWKSAAPEIASVTATGIVTGLNAGTTTIIATSTKDPSKTATVQISVSLMSIQSITLDQKIAYLNLKGQTVIHAQILPTHAPQKLVWTSNNPAIATVTSEGLITGISKGNAIIKATSSVDSTKYASMQVYINVPAVDTVLINQQNIRISIGTSTSLTATTLPADSPKEITWVSESPQIVHVDANGVITPLHIGEAVILAFSSAYTNKSASVRVSVVDDDQQTLSWSINSPTPVAQSDTTSSPSPSSSSSSSSSSSAIDHVSLSQTKIYLNIYDTLSLIGSILPKTAPQSLIWSSSNPNVAKIDSFTGKITAIGIGKSIITATSIANTGKSAQAEVYVNQSISSLTLDKSSLRLPIDGTAQLEATISPLGVYSNITWKSSNESIAKVDSTGKITAINSGKVTITASVTSDASKTDCATVTVFAPQTLNAYIGDNFTYTITDSQKDYFSYTVISKPIWMAYNAASKTLSGQPLASDSGVGTVLLQRNDGQYIEAVNVSVIFNPNSFLGRWKATDGDFQVTQSGITIDFIQSGNELIYTFKEAGNLSVFYTAKVGIISVSDTKNSTWELLSNNQINIKDQNGYDHIFTITNFNSITMELSNIENNQPKRRVFTRMN